MPSQNILDHLNQRTSFTCKAILNATTLVKMCSPIANEFLVNPVRI